MAINLHFNKEEVLPDLDEAVGDVAMETSSSVTESEGPSSVETPDKTGAMNVVPVEGINQSILSLLVKLMLVMTNSTSSSPGRLVKFAFKRSVTLMNFQN